MNHYDTYLFQYLKGHPIYWTYYIYNCRLYRLPQYHNLRSKKITSKSAQLDFFCFQLLRHFLANFYFLMSRYYILLTTILKRKKNLCNQNSTFWQSKKNIFFLAHTILLHSTTVGNNTNASFCALFYRTTWIIWNSLSRTQRRLIHNENS